VCVTVSLTVTIAIHLTAISADWFVPTTTSCFSCNDTSLPRPYIPSCRLPDWCHICKPCRCYRSALSIHCTVICLTTWHGTPTDIRATVLLLTFFLHLFQLISLSNSNTRGSAMQFFDKCYRFSCSFLRNVVFYLPVDWQTGPVRYFLHCILIFSHAIFLFYFYRASA